MTVKVGDTMPEGTLWEFDRKPSGAGAPKEYSVSNLCADKKIVIFGLPGAFTPTCSARHLPGFVAHSDEMLKHVNEIWCLSVNDAFVMDAWGDQQNAIGKVRMLGDGSGTYTKKLGLELDLVGNGMGMRMKRFSMLVDNNVIKTVNIEAPGKFESSSADVMLTQIQTS